MLPDRASNPGPLTYESGALPIALRGPAGKCEDFPLRTLFFSVTVSENVYFDTAGRIQIDLFHIVCAHAYIGHVARYFSIIGETLQRWGKRIFSH